MLNHDQPILIITGMHRSGTSLIAVLLQSAGLDIGQNLVAGNEGNPEGHFENAEFVQFHESVLYSLGIDKIGWTLETNLTPPESYLERAKNLIKENTSASQPWGWKEPRTTLFLDFWAVLLPEAQFLFVYRAPWEVIDSLYRRGDDIFHRHPQFALEVWMSYNRSILEFYQAQPERCLLLNLKTIVNAPSCLTEAIEDKLGIALSEPDVKLCRPSLLKQETSQSQRPQIIKRHFPEAFELYCQLNKTANFEEPALSELAQLPDNAWVLQDWLDVKLLQRKLKQETESSKNHLERVYHELGQCKGEIGSLDYRLQQSQQELAQTQTQLEQYQQELTQTQAQFQQSQLQLGDAHNQLQQYQQELAHLQNLLHQSQQESAHHNNLVQQSQLQLAHTHNQLQEARHQLALTHNQLEQSQQQLAHTHAQLEQFQERITAMESSKFWQIRKGWIKFKRQLRLSEEEI
jgi:hypothetical protein